MEDTRTADSAYHHVGPFLYSFSSIDTSHDGHSLFQSLDMNNVSCLAWRFPCPGPRAWSSSQPIQAIFRPAGRNFRISPSRPFSLYSRGLPSRGSLLRSSYPTAPRPLSPLSHPFRSFNNSEYLRAQNEPPVEHGVLPRDQSFSATEINKIFGDRDLPPAMGNWALAVLQGRRVAGTLDLQLPADIIDSVDVRNLEKALEWLRANYPLDEDAAIIARIHREEREEEARLIQRATDLGLYKPQSGSYDSELGEKGDVSGKSVLKEARKRNEERNKEIEEQRRREWLEGEAKDQEKLKRLATRSTAMQQAPEAGVAEGKLPIVDCYLAMVERWAYDLQRNLVLIPKTGRFWLGCRSIICVLRIWILMLRV